jgi:hypothetical protein
VAKAKEINANIRELLHSLLVEMESEKQANLDQLELLS